MGVQGDCDNERRGLYVSWTLAQISCWSWIYNIRLPCYVFCTCMGYTINKVGARLTHIYWSKKLEPDNKFAFLPWLPPYKNLCSRTGDGVSNWDPWQSDVWSRETRKSEEQQSEFGLALWEDQQQRECLPFKDEQQRGIWRGGWRWKGELMLFLKSVHIKAVMKL